MQPLEQQHGNAPLEWHGREKGRRNGNGKYLLGPAMYSHEGAHATWPIARMTKQIFVFDEPDRKAVWVGRGIPRHWSPASRPCRSKIRGR
jgi:hypothetical protein